MILTDVEKIDSLLREFTGKEVCLVTHQNPDGDGMCACIALSLCLENVYQAKPFIVMDGNFPSTLNFLNYQQCQYKKYQDLPLTSCSLPLLIVLDCHEQDRIDTDTGLFKMAEKVLVIDHHIAKPDELIEDYLYFIDTTAVSTGVIINRFLYRQVYKHSLQAYLTKKTSNGWWCDFADLIYTTILNDTDNFINSNTDAETFHTCEKLMRLGLQPNIVTTRFLYTKQMKYFRFIGQVLSTIEVIGKIGLYRSTMQMLADNDLSFDGYSKIMRWTKGAYDVEIQVFFAEYEDDLWRISLRSENQDVAKIAKHFDGGGHIKASGFQLKGKYDEVKNKVITYIENQL